MSAYQAKFLKLQPESSPGFIYLVQAAKTDKFKIGRAINVPNRLRGLQTSSPLKIRYVYHAYVQNMNLCEMELHHKFSNQREIGEWFTLTQKDVEFCIFLMRLVQDVEHPEPLTSQTEDEEPEEFKPLDSIVFCPEPEPNVTAQEQELVGKIMNLRFRGYGKVKIIAELWGASKGGGAKYKAAEAEYKRLVGE